MLGIMIGIGAVVCTVAIGQGGTSMVHEQLESLGSNMIWVEAGSRNINGVQVGQGETKSLSIEDARAIESSIPSIAAISPHVDDQGQVVYGNLNWFTWYRGVAPEYLNIAHWYVASGSVFTQQDVDRLANVCLIGRTLVQQLFRNEDPLGKTIRLKDQPLRVIGILEAKGATVYGRDQDDIVMVPFTTAMRKLKGITWVDDIFISAASPEAIAPAEDAIAQLLRQRHHLRSAEADDFNLRHPQDILKSREEASRTFTLMLGSIASVSLLVGGIGIMNIMLVSVTERTREIGLRMAVGATEKNVQAQFLMEALTLSLLGGAAGVIFGIVASVGVSKALQWPALISPAAILVAAIFSGAIGVSFGYYPARQASRLDPIEALRYD